jgi:hypothetical protein
MSKTQYELMQRIARWRQLERQLDVHTEVSTETTDKRVMRFYNAATLRALLASRPAT